MLGTWDTTAEREIRRKLIYIAWRRFAIPPQEAEDLVQNACLTWLTVREKYAGEPNHEGILIGIFRNKCREHLSQRKASQVRMARYRNENGGKGRSVVEGDGEAEAEDVLDELVAREDSHAILSAIAELREEAREMLTALVEVGRRGLLESSGLNPNTLDSRLHIYRRELRRILRRHGITI